MKYYNKHTIVGDVSSDPKMIPTSTGLPMLAFQVETKEEWESKDGKNHIFKQWHDVSVFGNLAQAVMCDVVKGEKIFIEGPSKKRKVKDSYRSEIHASNVIAM